jgi:MraZ protein
MKFASFFANSTKKGGETLIFFGLQTCLCGDWWYKVGKINCLYGAHMKPFKFHGHHQHNMDSKNRVAIPAKFREQIGNETLMVMESFDGCLQAMTQSDWQKLADKKLEGLDFIASAKDREVERMFYGSMEMPPVDKQGRIQLTPEQVRAAGLSKEVIFKGVRNRFEIWDRKRWEAHRAEYMKREAEGLL